MAKELPFESLDSLLPGDFFHLLHEISYVKDSSSETLKSPYLLPDVSPLFGEEKFADFHLGWNERGLLGYIKMSKPYEQSFFPNYEEGDSVEVFIDTRDLKKTGFATKFCHHFVFLSHEVQEIQVQEVTKFRSEDSHPLCDSSEIECKCVYGKKEYSMLFFIPSSCLHGYDPQTFPRMGFTFKINRYKGQAQHFSVSSHYFDIMQSPSHWSSLIFIQP